MRTLSATILMTLTSIIALGADSPPRTWEGTWVNKRYNSNGTLKCVATPGKDGEWSAKFSGVFMKEQFSYDVTFQSKAGKGQTDLSGTAEIRNHKYEWSGYIKGDTLFGRFRSNGGYFGEFTLKEKKK